MMPQRFSERAASFRGFSRRVLIQLDTHQTRQVAAQNVGKLRLSRNGSLPAKKNVWQQEMKQRSRTLGDGRDLVSNRVCELCSPSKVRRASLLSTHRGNGWQSIGSRVAAGYVRFVWASWLRLGRQQSSGGTIPILSYRLEGQPCLGL